MPCAWPSPGSDDVNIPFRFDVNKSEWDIHIVGIGRPAGVDSRIPWEQAHGPSVSPVESGIFAT